jgi:hypothetical protein
MGDGGRGTRSGFDDFRLIADRGRMEGGEVGGVLPLDDNREFDLNPWLVLGRSIRSSSLKLTRRFPRSGLATVSPPDLVLSLIELALPSTRALIRSADSRAESAPYSSGL